MTVDEFYAESAALLVTTHEGEAFPHWRRNRWNNRLPGRGRFPGRGIIRVFGDIVHFALHHPVSVNTTVEGLEDALEFLREKLVDQPPQIE